MGSATAPAAPSRKARPERLARLAQPERPEQAPAEQAARLLAEPATRSEAIREVRRASGVEYLQGNEASDRRILRATWKDTGRLP